MHYLGAKLPSGYGGYEALCSMESLVFVAGLKIYYNRNS